MNESLVEFAVELLGLAQPVRIRVTERQRRAAAWVACGSLESNGIGATAREALAAALAPLGRRRAVEVMAAPAMFAASAQLLASREGMQVTGHEIGLPPCPVCGSTDAIRIAYGYPSLEMGLAADRGEIALGGCLVGPESPDYECRNCHAPLPWVAPAPTGRSAGGGQGIGLGSQGIGHA